MTLNAIPGRIPALSLINEALAYMFFRLLPHSLNPKELHENLNSWGLLKKFQRALTSAYLG